MQDAAIVGAPWLTLQPSLAQHKIRWNPELQEWFCATCGRTSDHLVHDDADAQMERCEFADRGAL